MTSIAIKGYSLFQELDLICIINNTDISYSVTKVNSTHLLCPLGQHIPGEYQILIHSKAVNLLINREPVLLNIHRPPILLYTDRHLVTKSHPDNLSISLTMDSSLDSEYIA